MTALVFPSIAITPCLWIAVASRAAGSPGVTVQVVALSGLLASLAGTNGARTYAYACGKSVRAARRRAEACLAICAAGIALVALTAAVVRPATLGLLAITATAALALVLTGVGLWARLGTS